MKNEKALLLNKDTLRMKSLSDILNNSTCRLIKKIKKNFKFFL